MYRIPGIRPVLAVAILITLSSAPAASARGPEPPRSGARVEAGWLTTAMRWLEELTGLRRPGASVNKEDTTGGVTGGTIGGGNASTTGGSCIDPQGNPRPLCGV
ncbi:MAG TPA: hypothetical protein VG477_16945 [Thermoanaerobaculia bacterium]|nr:hypothetical protein [Thermoanaerobaculia bacterium]